MFMLYLQPFLDQNNRDKDLQALVEKMSDVYSHLIKTILQIWISEEQRRVLELTSSQTAECAKFIQRYCENKNFGRFSYYGSLPIHQSRKY